MNISKHKEQIDRRKNSLTLNNGLQIIYSKQSLKFNTLVSYQLRFKIINIIKN